MSLAFNIVIKANYRSRAAQQERAVREVCWSEIEMMVIEDPSFAPLKLLLIQYCKIQLLWPLRFLWVSQLPPGFTPSLSKLDLHDYLNCSHPVHTFMHSPYKLQLRPTRHNHKGMQTGAAPGWISLGPQHCSSLLLLDLGQFLVHPPQVLVDIFTTLFQLNLFPLIFSKLFYFHILYVHFQGAVEEQELYVQIKPCLLSLSLNRWMTLGT